MPDQAILFDFAPERARSPVRGRSARLRPATEADRGEPAQGILPFDVPAIAPAPKPRPRPVPPANDGTERHASQRPIDLSTHPGARLHVWRRMRRAFGLTSTEHSVLGVLVSLDGPSGIKVSQEWIADECDMPLRTVNHAISGLKRKGAISTKGGRTSNRYVAHYATGCVVTASPQPLTTQPVAQSGTQSVACNQGLDQGKHPREHARGSQRRAADVAGKVLTMARSPPVVPGKSKAVGQGGRDGDMAHHPGGLMRNPDTAHEDEAERYYRDAFRFGIDYMRERIPYGELRRRVDIERMNEAAGKRGEP